MSDHPHSNFEVGENAFIGLSTQIFKDRQRITAIGDGKTDKDAQYARVIASFTETMQKGSDVAHVTLDEKEKLFLVNELATNRAFLTQTLECSAFDSIMLMMQESSWIAIYKKLFLIYFNYFDTLQARHKLEALQAALKNFLHTYRGKNRVILKYQVLYDVLFGPMADLLDRYGGDFATLKHDLNLQDDSEYAKMLIRHKIVSAVKTLAYDENAPELFATVTKHKDFYFDEGLTVKEYIARFMIGRALQERRPYHHWQQFVFRLAGDPRSMRAHSPTLRTWNNIGREEAAYFIKTLFKDDMKLFLDLLSDPASDPDYAYRKAFWMPFLEHVVFAKVFIADTVFPTLSSELKERFQLHNDSYGILQGSYGQSAIYMDFGRLKIIEFTRIGHVRAFRECPMNLRKKSYSMKELDYLRFLSSCLFPIKHGGSKTYRWQKDLLPYMNRGLGLNVTEEEIRIPEDKAKRPT